MTLAFADADSKLDVDSVADVNAYGQPACKISVFYAFSFREPVKNYFLLGGTTPP